MRKLMNFLTGRHVAPTTLQQVQQRFKHLEDRFVELSVDLGARERQVELLNDALARIAACETPNSNGTVRKMAKIAREALNN